MTDPPTPPPPDDGLLPDDELVSAVLDGEATPAEVARVQADPVLQARVERFRAVAAAVAAPVPRDPEAEARHLDEATRAWAGRHEPATVVDLDARRHRRAARLLGAAALVALALLVPALLVLLGQSGDESSDETAASVAAPSSTVADAAAEAATAEDGGQQGADGAPQPDAPAGSAESSGSTTTVPTTPADLGDLGAVTQPEEVTGLVSTALAAPAPAEAGASEPTAPPTEPPVTAGAATTTTDACLSPVQTADGTAVVRARAEVTIGGLPRVVYVVDTVDGRTEIVVVDPATCTIVTRLSL